MYKHIYKKDQYNKLLSSGMFWEFHPELTGDWEKDKLTISDTKAIFKFNNGNGALLCSSCFTIIKVGKQFTEFEKIAMNGDIFLESQYCKKCNNG